MPPAMSLEVVNEYGKPAVRMAIENAAVLLDAEDIDRLIHHLGYLRAGIRPDVPTQPSTRQQFVLEMDPCWHTEKHPLYDGVVLILRHSGLGWTGFALPTHSLTELREAINQHLAALDHERCMPN
ncbi:hypothetical protein LMG27174_05241 [Paraburkholderia rhynchosiae]|uniref:Uncharacterized protein n=2 Tax=Paraburkholderia rhynchosiae TaxID=487049 RepID=A0A2N7WDS8_9BURK|nr:hypothetical protein [Paraburkholderia rhynchosiae]PMS27521.1 hypothetical protein C0Z16_24555 [Paraburkholderia rhynchosiae]CAB3724487.1 hypothetical protein LMG27174_05241 [Paraburkholderia rhynchosiae]